MLTTTDIVGISIASLSWGLAWMTILRGLHGEYEYIPHFIRSLKSSRARVYSIIAHGVTSLGSFIIAIVAIGIGLYQTHRGHPGVLLTGPIMPHTRVFYLIFIGYASYNVVWRSMGDESHLVLIAHQLIYLVVGIMLLHSELLPLAALLLASHELSTPFSNIRRIMIELKQKNTKSYWNNRIIFSGIFFIFHILTPLVFFVYVGIKAPNFIWESIYTRSILGIMVSLYVFELYWFYKICRGLYVAISEKYKDISDVIVVSETEKLLVNNNNNNNNESELLDSESIKNEESVEVVE